MVVQSNTANFTFNCLYFSRRSYLERLTVLGPYIFIVVPLRTQPHNPGIASAILYQLSYKGLLYKPVIVEVKITALIFSRKTNAYILFRNPVGNTC